MTTQHQHQGWPPQPPLVPPTPQPPIPPKRHSRRTAIILGLVGVVATLVALSYALQPTTTPAPAARAPAATAAPVTEPATTPETTYPTPQVSDFALKVKVLEKTNFGSAGSNITYRIVAGWDGLYDPDKTYEVTYQVRGGEDGPSINTMTVTGNDYQVDSEETVSTASVGQRLTAKVTSVEEL